MVLPLAASVGVLPRLLCGCILQNGSLEKPRLSKGREQILVQPPNVPSLLEKEEPQHKEPGLEAFLRALPNRSCCLWQLLSRSCQ